MRSALSFFIASACVGCAALGVPEGMYEVIAYDASGTALRSAKVLTNKSGGLYSTRNALCINHPKSRVVIKAIPLHTSHPGLSWVRM